MNPNHETSKKESIAIILIMLLLLTGSVFYGITVFRKAKAERIAAEENGYILK